VLARSSASQHGENFFCDKIKRSRNRVIPRTFSPLTFVKMRNETFMAAGDTFLTGIAFIEPIEIKRKYQKAAFRINLGAARVFSCLSQVF